MSTPTGTPAGASSAGALARSRSDQRPGSPSSSTTHPPGRDEQPLVLPLVSASAAARSQREHHKVPPDRDHHLADRLTAALDNLAAGVVVVDEDGTEVYRNEAADALARVAVEDGSLDGVMGEALDRARQGRLDERDLEVGTPARRSLTVRAYPVAGSTGPLGAVAVVEDVSERRRIEAMRRDFVANVSHELKTPVGALSLLAETLDGEEDPDTVARLSARVAMEAERLGNIIDDLLDLSRIEADEFVPQETMPLDAVVAEAVRPLRMVAVDRGIRLDVRYARGAWQVQGDRRDLVAAVSNLVDNAIKYSDSGSTIRVRVVAQPDVSSVTVVDQGIGIPARDRERIFERFYRVDRARSRLTGGTGLGLSIVRHVVANHGGTVDVDSEEGKGSTFTLTLPTAARSGPNPLEDLDG